MSAPEAPQGPDTASDGGEPRQSVVLISGISGSGKTVALHALEDAGYYCVDNLPPELIPQLVRLEHARLTPRVAIAVDVRSVHALPHVPRVLAQLRQEPIDLKVVFLDATNDTLVRRFSETRRRHPLSDRVDDVLDEHRALVEAIELERELLSDLRAVASVVDTSQLRAAQLRSWIKQIVQAPAARLTLVFQSFAFKHGVPLDADYVFDVRVLPNPHYVDTLRPLTGRDAAVVAFLDAQPDAVAMFRQIGDFLDRWLGAFEEDHRNYLTVAIGCTGGQHRSVYGAELLARRFEHRYVSLSRHRELDGRG